jgi:hypothetical protein
MIKMKINYSGNPSNLDGPNRKRATDDTRKAIWVMYLLGSPLKTILTSGDDRAYMRAPRAKIYPIVKLV